MAAVTITNDVLNLNEFKTLTFTACSVDGTMFDFTPADQKMVLVFQNTGAGSSTVTLKAGNGLQGVNDLDAFSIPASGFAAVRLDSGSFKNVSGDNKGKVVVIPSAATIKACAIQLP